MPPTVTLRRVPLIRTDVSEECIAFSGHVTMSNWLRNSYTVDSPCPQVIETTSSEAANSITLSSSII
jgi:hypothetical protein